MQLDGKPVVEHIIHVIRPGYDASGQAWFYCDQPIGEIAYHGVQHNHAHLATCPGCLKHEVVAAAVVEDMLGDVVWLAC